MKGSLLAQVGVMNAENVTVVINTPLTHRRCKPFKKLPPELREQFITYFLKKYPITRKIRVGTDEQRRYTARAHYKAEANRTIYVTARTYETLVIRLDSAYKSRNIPHANNR